MAITKIGTPELFDFSATNTALQLPTGDTASRPSAPSAGQWRFNTTEKYVEYWDGGAWRQIDTEALPNPDDFPSQNFNVNTYFGTGATQEIDAKFNEAANFGSSTSNVILADNSIFDGTGPWSMSLWANIKNYGGTSNRMFLMDKPGGAGNYGWQLEYDNSGIGFKFQIFDTSNNYATITVGANTALNTWVNVVITISSGSVAKIYLDKTLKNTSSAIGTISTNDANVNIGDYSLASGYNYEGSLDQLRFFNQELNQTQINSLYDDETTTTAATLDFPVGAGCVAAYPFDGDASDVGGTYGGVETDIGYTGLKFEPDMIWIKTRNQPNDHNLVDSIRGTTKYLRPNRDIAEVTQSDGVTSFDTNGFTVGVGGDFGGSNNKYVAWCWYAPTSESVSASGSILASTIKKNVDAGFSIVQYDVASQSSSQQISHGLGVAPKLIIDKIFNTSGFGWTVYTEPTGTGNYLTLNAAGQAAPDANFCSVVNDTIFQSSYTSQSNTQHIAYCFADIAGYQKIGSYTGTGASGNSIVTGFEPAFIMLKVSTASDNWLMYDNKRGDEVILYANLSNSEDSFVGRLNFNTNGFTIDTTDAGWNGSGKTYIYLAIAADKDSSVPTLANSFSPTLYDGNGATQNIYIPFAPDFVWAKQRNGSDDNVLFDTVRGPNKEIISNSTGAQANKTDAISSFNSNSFVTDANGALNASGSTYVSWNWKAGGLPTINSDGDITSIVSANQAAGFSIVKYNGATNATSDSSNNGGVGWNIGHSLGVAPSLIIIKKINSAASWYVGADSISASPWTTGNGQHLVLNETGGVSSPGGSTKIWNSAPTTTTFNVGGWDVVNRNGDSYIAYCFADIAGYQKVGTYNGSGVSGKQVTGLGFDPSFLIIKRVNNTDAFSSWYMFDDKRTTGVYSDQLQANTSNIESTGTYVDFITDGFQLDTTASNLNNSGSDFVYIAIG